MTTSTPIEEISDQMLRDLLTTDQITPQRYLEELERRKSLSTSKKIEDGGPAFPRTERYPDGEAHFYSGMSRRDWFAGQAIPAIIRQCASDLNFIDRGEKAEQYFARKAYQVADALIEASKSGGEA
ncbi:hypothetical protein NN6n1_12770 [Shinella zoogloeoides]